MPANCFSSIKTHLQYLHFVFNLFKEYYTKSRACQYLYGLVHLTSFEICPGRRAYRWLISFICPYLYSYAIVLWLCGYFSNRNLAFNRNEIFPFSEVDFNPSEVLLSSKSRNL
jgi:hypothetical protein